LWLVEPGSRVKKGDIIAEVETDKGIIQMSLRRRYCRQILVQTGVEVPVHSPRNDKV
jgi:pyruvate/2-oxoglutarate dehydrogenase complex dihydrolipoamide acyltransferase (E2) component